MPRKRRLAPGWYCYHVLNRAVGRRKLFHKPGDYEALLGILEEALARTPTRLLSFCVMPNHWHMILWPRTDGELTSFMRWFTQTHSQRYHAFHQTTGTGPLYQGRFKSFPLENDEHFLVCARYIERNPLRSGLVRRAENWAWSSLHLRRSRPKLAERLLSEWPIDAPHDWVEEVNAAQPQQQIEALRLSIVRGRPFGSQSWTARTAGTLDLNHTLQPRGRPRKSPEPKK